MDSMDNFRERFEALEQRTEHLQPPPRLVTRRRRWGRGLAWGAGLLALGLSILEGMAMAQAQGPPCSPAAYTQVTNSAPFPRTFCAYAWSPYRNRLPDTPQHIDDAQTQTLQQDYAPNSGPTQLTTIGALPTGPNQGDGGYAVFVAAASDPRVTVNCAQVQRYYGCSDSDGQSLAQVTDTYQIPAWVRPSVAFDEAGNPGGDLNMEIIQPDGRTIAIHGCYPSRDWQDGDVIGEDICPAAGVAVGSMVTSAGVNPGNLNGGDNFAALPVHYADIVQGQINHPMVGLLGCTAGAVYPALYDAQPCNPYVGLPAGARIWLALTRDQIDAQDASVIPVHMRPFAYALHEYGMYVLDSTGGGQYVTQPFLESAYAMLESGAADQSPWTDWFVANGGARTSDQVLKMEGPGLTIDFSQLASHLYVLDVCYARGTCSDSVPE